MYVKKSKPPPKREIQCAKKIKKERRKGKERNGKSSSNLMFSSRQTVELKGKI